MATMNQAATAAAPKGGSFLVEELQPQDVFTPEDFSEEHRQIAKTAIDFTQNEVMPAAAEIEAKNFAVTRGLLRKAGELGLMGVDIPEAVNLVFMKPVQSPIKLQQMIGRGTRSQQACKKLELLPNFEKKEFLVVDFWDNNFSRDAREAPDNATPVMVRVFNTRLNLLETYLDDQQNPECRAVIHDLRAMPEIEDAWQEGFWNYLLPGSIKKLRERVGPHLRYAA